MRSPRPLLFLAAAILLHASAFAEPAQDREAAIALYREKKNNDARAAFERIAAEKPDDPEALYFLGRIALRENQLEDSARFHEQAVALAPDNLRYLLDLAEVCGKRASSAPLFSKLAWARKCQSALDRAVALAPDDFEANDSLVQFYRQAPPIAGGGWNKAYTHAEKFRLTDPPGGTRILAGLYQRQQRPADALRVLFATLEQHPRDLALLELTGTIALASSLETERAAAALTRGIDPDASDPQTTRLLDLLAQLQRR